MNGTIDERIVNLLKMQIKNGAFKTKDDLIKVANEYGEFYLLQDYLREDGHKNISAIVCDKNIKKYTEYNGRIWKATKEDIVLIKNLYL